MKDGQVRLADLVGLTRIKQLASVGMLSATARKTVFDHTLLWGLGGTGKTAIARAIGSELGYYFVEVEGAAFRTRGDVLECLALSSVAAQKSHRTLLLFLDEVHRLHPKIQEALYIPMVESRSTSTDGDIIFPPFTLFAATTRRDMLDERSFVERFPNKWEVTRYKLIHMQEIVAALFRSFSMTCSQELVREVAARCLGIPRIAVNLTKKVRDFTLADAQWTVAENHLRQAFALEGIDKVGLSRLHHRYLRVLDESASTRGVASIAAQLNQPQALLREYIEPILCELRLIEHGPRGRIITERGRRYIKPMAASQGRGKATTGDHGLPRILV